MNAPDFQQVYICGLQLLIGCSSNWSPVFRGILSYGAMAQSNFRKLVHTLHQIGNKLFVIEDRYYDIERSRNTLIESADNCHIFMIV